MFEEMTNASVLSEKKDTFSALFQNVIIAHT